MFPFVIVTGLSGAGKFIFLKSLEDLVYKMIGNLPLSLLRPAIEEKRPGGKPLAIGDVDVRSRDFSHKNLLENTHALKAGNRFPPFFLVIILPSKNWGKYRSIFTADWLNRCKRKTRSKSIIVKKSFKMKFVILSERGFKVFFFLKNQM